MKQLNLLIGAAVFQVFSLILMIMWASYPLFFGQEIAITVEPIDPRSLFRGNYVTLSYPFSQLEEKHFIEELPVLQEKIQPGSIVYVKLTAQDDVYVLEKASLKPFGTNDIYLKGRVKSAWTHEHDKFKCWVAYGIEAYFTQKEKALEWEKNINQHHIIAKIKVLPSGRAGVKSLELK